MAEIAVGALGKDDGGYRAEFVDLVRKAQGELRAAAVKRGEGRQSQCLPVCGRQDACLPLHPLRPLPAVFIQGHRGGVGDVVGIGQAPDGDFDDRIDKLQLFFGQAEPLVADDQRRAARELIVVQADGIRRLLQANQREAVGFQLL